MNKYIVLGMAIQAITASILSFLHTILLTSQQQLIVGIGYLFVVLLMFYLEKKQ